MFAPLAAAALSAPADGPTALLADSAASPAAALAGSSRGSIPTRTTFPDVIIRHNISDDELTVLSAVHSDHLRDRLRDIMLTAIGAFLGSLPGLAKLADDISNANPGPIGWAKVFDIGIPIGALVAVLVTFILLFFFKSQDPSGDLAQKIRRRTPTE